MRVSRVSTTSFFLRFIPGYELSARGTWQPGVGVRAGFWECVWGVDTGSPFSTAARCGDGDAAAPEWS